jgi:hypothetical protein
LLIVLVGVSQSVQASRPRQGAFTTGNIVVYRVGDGSAALTSAADRVYVDEYTTAGTFVQTIALPTVVNGSQRRLTAGGFNVAEGFLTRSVDKRYLILAGYDAAVGSASVASSNVFFTNRVVGRIDFYGNVDTSTALSDAFDAQSVMSATSTDGLSLWVSGSGNSSTGGVWYVPFGSQSAMDTVQVSNTVGSSIRQLHIFDNQLYASTNQSSFRITTVGSGLPTVTGATMVNLPGTDIPNITNPYSFFFADLDAGVAGFDTLYVAEDSAGNRVKKFSLVGGTWVLNGNFATGQQIRGLIGTVSGSTVTLYGTTFTSPSFRIVSIVDTTGYNQVPSATANIIVTAGTNTAFRGIAFAPEAPPGAATTTPTPTPTTSPTASETFTPSATFTPSGTSTITETPTVTFTPSITPSPTLTPPDTATPTFTPSVTPTPTLSPTATLPPVILPDTIGIYKQGEWVLKFANAAGAHDIYVVWGNTDDFPVVGDWNGDGVDTLGLYRNFQFVLSNSNTAPAINYEFSYGISGDYPLAGRWANDMVGSGVGIYRNSIGVAMLRKSLTFGVSDIDLVFGSPGDTPVAGDWNGDGIDTIATYRPVESAWYLTNQFTTGYYEHETRYVWDANPLRIVAGDWDANGIMSPGYFALPGVFALRFSNEEMAGEQNFAYGYNDTAIYPVAGKWQAGSQPPKPVGSVIIPLPPPNGGGGSVNGSEGGAD